MTEKKGKSGRSLPDEAVEAAKRGIIFGETVGYKQPPMNTRFQKGQSGNPKGRPKTSGVLSDDNPSIGAVLLKEAEKLINVQEGGEPRQASVLQAVIRSTIKSAFSGNSHAQRYFLEKADSADRERRRAMDASNEFWREIRDKQREVYEKAERNGEPPPRIFPHPDDIIIDDKTGVRLIGPIDEEEAVKLEETIKLRDVLLMQATLDERMAPEGGDDYRSAAHLFSHLIDRQLPERYRLSDMDFIMHDFRMVKPTNRELLKTLRAEWQAIGIRVPRGFTFPPLSGGIEIFEAIADLVDDARAGDCDVLCHAERLQSLARKGMAAKQAAAAA